MANLKREKNKQKRRKGGEKAPRTLEPVDDDGVATDRAIVRFTREDLNIEGSLPGWVVLVLLAVIGPWLTLRALPEEFPAWMTFVLLLAQLAVTVYVVFVAKRRGGSR